MDDRLVTEHLERLTRLRITELDRTRAHVEALELRAGLVSDLNHERRKLDILSTMYSPRRSLPASPPLMEGRMGEAVAELRSYLQSTYEADLVGDPALQSMTLDHAVRYAVRLLDMMADGSHYATKGGLNVLEVASSTISMFAQRPSAHQAIWASGAIGIMVKLLSPLYPAVAVSAISAAVGHLAVDVDCRLAFRSAGGVGALVRLLRSDCEPTVQTAAAAALSLLAARDVVVQDSVRYLGGIDHLVDMLASPDAYLAEVARYALLSLRHRNVKNQAEIMTTARASPALAKDVRRLEAAADLLRFEADPLGAGHAGSPSGRSTYTARQRLFDESLSTPPRPRTADSYLRAPATPSYPYTPTVMRASSPYSPYSVATPPAAALLSSGYESVKSRALTDQIRLLTSPRAADDWAISTLLLSIESDAFRRRHLARYTVQDVVALVEHLGFDDRDVRGVRAARLDGPRLLSMHEDDLEAELLMPSARLRKLVQLQRATRLFDRIATLPLQGKVGEAEVRRHLTGLNVSHVDATKTIKLLKALVKTDRDDFITFLDFVMGYEWVAQAFRIYGVRA